MVIKLVPSVEMVRFVSSGTEACLSVLRLMRAYTKREKIIKFVGCYHGHAGGLLAVARACRCAAGSSAGMQVGCRQ